MKLMVKRKIPLQYLPKLAILLMVLLISSPVLAGKKLKPFILVDDAIIGDIKKIVAQTKEKLASGGFEVIGEYSPF